MRRARFLFWLDLALLVAVVLLQEPRPTGLPIHEWLGLAFAALLALHLLVNWRWIVNTLGRLRTNTRRARVNATLNGALYVGMVLTIYSGVAISEVALPLAGLAPSDLRAWRQLHALIARVTLGIVGLHLALNWDWIGNVIRKWRTRRAEHGRSLSERLGLDEAGRTAARFARLTVVTAAVCAASLLLVKTLASDRVRQRPERRWATPTDDRIRRRSEPRWATPDLAAAPEAIGVQLVVVLVGALVGRYLLRLRL